MTKLERWIDSQGGPKAVARKLGTESPMVYNWIAGLACPRPLTMQKVVRMSKGALSYDDVINCCAKKPKRRGAK